MTVGATLPATTREPQAQGVATVKPKTPRPDFRSRSRRLDDHYSRRVALLKRFLPVLGLTLLALVAIWPRLGPLLESVRLGFPVIDLRDARELRMLNPRYAGIDRFNRPYVVTAAVGRQVPNRDDLMSLERPKAEVTTHSGAVVVVTATTALYQSQAQLLDLFDDVNLLHENGTRFVTKAAHVDVSANAAEGHDPVTGHGPSGDITAQGFRILDKGDTIIFKGKSDLLLKGSKPSAKPSMTPPSLPAEVQETAAQLEASATTPPVGATETPAPTGVVAGPAPAEPMDRRSLASRSRSIAKRDGKLPAGGASSGGRAKGDAG
jgi:lipopolysaccharide export system protein LptC